MRSIKGRSLAAAGPSRPSPAPRTHWCSSGWHAPALSAEPRSLSPAQGVNGEGVPQRVDRRSLDPSFSEVLADDVLDRTRPHPPAELALEDAVVLGLGRPNDEVPLQRLTRSRVQRHQPMTPAMPDADATDA